MSKLTKAQRQHNKTKKLEYLGKARNKVEKRQLYEQGIEAVLLDRFKPCVSALAKVWTELDK